MIDEIHKQKSLNNQALFHKKEKLPVLLDALQRTFLAYHK